MDNLKKVPAVTDRDAHLPCGLRQPMHSFLAEVRQLQRKRKCSDKLCEEFVAAFEKHSDTKKHLCLRTFDVQAKKKAGAKLFILHGCTNCQRHVYAPWDKNTTCPHRKKDGTICGHGRYQENGKPLEVCLCKYCFRICIIAHAIYLNA